MRNKFDYAEIGKTLNHLFERNGFRYHHTNWCNDSDACVKLIMEFHLRVWHENDPIKRIAVTIHSDEELQCRDDPQAHFVKVWEHGSAGRAFRFAVVQAMIDYLTYDDIDDWDEYACFPIEGDV